MTKTMLLMLILFCISISSYAEDPTITMTTTIEAGETITFNLKAQSENTTIQIDYGDGNLVDQVIGNITTSVSGTVKGEKIVIYGNTITYLSSNSNSLTSLDVTNCGYLTSLSCYSNSLTTLDVSNNTDLSSLDCSFNSLTSLDLPNSSSLTYLNCYYNSLTILDVSKNTSLTSLSCSFNSLETLDVLNNADLTYLGCGNNSLETLDISNNTALQTLSCSSNSLTSLDATNCTDLITLICSFNSIENLYVAENSVFTLLNCTYNKLSFSTLPPTEVVSDYNYAGQEEYEISENIALGSPIDLSSQYSIDGNTTNYVWKTKGGTVLTENDDYTITDGVTTFLKTQTEKIYCEMTNDAFPDFTGGSIFKTSSANVTTATGIGTEVQSSSVKIYSGVNSIIVKADIDAQVSVFDISGNSVAFKNITIGDNAIRGISPGVYIVNVKTAGVPIVNKVFVR